MATFPISCTWKHLHMQDKSRVGTVFPFEIKYISPTHLCSTLGLLRSRASESDRLLGWEELGSYISGLFLKRKAPYLNLGRCLGVPWRVAPVCCTGG